MKRLSITMSVIALLLISLINFGCKGRDTVGSGSAVTDFYVVRFLPSPDSTDVSPDESMEIAFSMPVDQSNLSDPAVFKVESMPTTGTLADKKVVSGVTSLTNSGYTLLFRPSTGSWTYNNIFTVTLANGLKSTSNISLGQVQQYSFTVGLGSGKISVPGKPKVDSIRFDNSTFRFWVQFNEDLVVDPKAYVELTIKLPLGLGDVSNGIVQLTSQPIYPDGRRYYYLIFPFINCDTFFILGQVMTLRIFDGRDNDQEMMDPKSQDFHWPGDYSDAYGSCNN